MERYIEILKDFGVAPSMQRLKILEYLSNYKTHPTAEMIYQALSTELPTLSKTTVYNTLKTFTEKGILSTLSLFDPEIHYEYNKTPHIHFKCIKCRKIYDIFNDAGLYQKNTIDGHKIMEYSINLTGICRECRNSDQS